MADCEPGMALNPMEFICAGIEIEILGNPKQIVLFSGKQCPPSNSVKMIVKLTVNWSIGAKIEVKNFKKKLDQANLMEFSI